MKKLTRLLMVSLAGATFLAACGDTTTVDEEEPAIDEVQEEPVEEEGVEEEPGEGEEDAGDEG